MENFVPERIFKPLGMTNSTMLIKQMEKAKDHSFGYDYNFDTKETKKRPFREIAEVAPAGSINSSARDMAEWVRFVLNGGILNGKRLVSERGFEEWLKPQMKMDPTGRSNYGLGWFLQTWNGLKVVQHGGNIDGFNSLVAMIPEKKIGFVMLTNVSGSSMGSDIMPVIWSNLLTDTGNEGAKLPVATLKLMAGKYGNDRGQLEVKIEREDLVLIVPGQPPYKLERTAPRTFRAIGLPDGFGAKFTPETGAATELELIQPQGNRKLPRVGGEASTGSAATNTSAVKELVGKYSPPGGGPASVEIKEGDGKITFNIPGQQPYALAQKTDGSFSLSPLPETYFLNVKREGAKIVSVVVTQPEGVFEFKRVDGDTKPPVSVDDLHRKAVEAIGGEANWRRIKSRVTETEVDLLHQGVKARATTWAKAPNKTATETKMIALGKTIASGWEFFDGTTGIDAYTFSPAEKYEGKRLDDAKLNNDFYGMLDWSTNFKKVEVAGVGKVNGEDAYIVSFEPKAGTAFRQFYSTATFLLLKHEGVVPSSTSAQQLPYSITFSDYREIDGIKLPFKTVNNTLTNGDIVSVVTSVKHNVTVDDNLFAPRKLQ